jgi:hypothetical protein
LRGRSQAKGRRAAWSQIDPLVMLSGNDPRHIVGGRPLFAHLRLLGDVANDVKQTLRIAGCLGGPEIVQASD